MVRSRSSHTCRNPRPGQVARPRILIATVTGTGQSLSTRLVRAEAVCPRRRRRRVTGHSHHPRRTANHPQPLRTANRRDLLRTASRIIRRRTASPVRCDRAIPARSGLSRTPSVQRKAPSGLKRTPTVVARTAQPARPPTGLRAELFPENQHRGTQQVRIRRHTAQCRTARLVRLQRAWDPMAWAQTATPATALPVAPSVSHAKATSIADAVEPARRSRPAPAPSAPPPLTRPWRKSSKTPATGPAHTPSVSARTAQAHHRIPNRTEQLVPALQVIHRHRLGRRCRPPRAHPREPRPSGRADTGSITCGR